MTQVQWEYKGHLYETIDKCAMLRKENGWVKCVIYKRVGEDGLYVRDCNEFFEKFKEIKHNTHE